jgi:hypothetical protein
LPDSAIYLVSSLFHWWNGDFLDLLRQIRIFFSFLIRLKSCLRRCPERLVRLKKTDITFKITRPSKKIINSNCVSVKNQTDPLFLTTNPLLINRIRHNFKAISKPFWGVVWKFALFRHGSWVVVTRLWVISRVTCALCLLSYVS